MMIGQAGEMPMEKYGHGGARTLDPELIRLMLYHLSYATDNFNTRSRDRTGDLLRVKQAS